MNLAKSQ